jgi:hypothetical protein
MKTERSFVSIHDKSFRNSALAPPCLFPMRNGIYLRAGRAVLVQGRNRAPADAAGWRGLRMPRLPAQGSGAGEREGVIGKNAPLQRSRRIHHRLLDASAATALARDAF